MNSSVVILVVDAHHDGDVLVGCRRRDNYLLRTTGNVLLSICCLSEEAGRFNNDIRLYFAPWKICWILLREDAESLSTHRNGVI